MKKLLSLVLCLIMVCSLVACGNSESTESGEPAAEATELTFGTGGDQGTYYGYGSVLSQYVSEKTDVSVTAVTSKGSQANIEDMAAGDIQLGFVQSDVMSYAYSGTNLFEEKVEGFSTVATALSANSCKASAICQPSVPLIQCCTGRFFPS